MIVRAAADDDERIAYTSAALSSLLKALADGVPVIGYLHLSLLDNFEWVHGYGPTFGLVWVDRHTFVHPEAQPRLARASGEGQRASR